MRKLILQALQVCMLLHITKLNTAQAQPIYNFTVTALTSSVMASKRTFACETEDVVYRCVAERNRTAMNNGSFNTIWQWANVRVDTFNSMETIGLNNTCKTPANLPFLHSTLVSANDTTCVSLLIVTPSLTPSTQRYIDFNEENIIIQCAAFEPGTPTSLRHNQMIKHNISGKPEWDNNAQDNINVSVNCDRNVLTNDTNFLLNVSWPAIINANKMDFDFYILQFEILDVGVTSTAQILMSGTSYVYTFSVSSLANNYLTTQITINAVNRCKDMSNAPLHVSHTLNKDLCKEYTFVGTKNDSCSCNSTDDPPSTEGPTNAYYINNSHAIILFAGLLVHFSCFGHW